MQNPFLPVPQRLMAGFRWTGFTLGVTAYPAALPRSPRRDQLTRGLRTAAFCRLTSV